MAADGFESGNYTDHWVVHAIGSGTATVIEAAKQSGTYGLRFTSAGNLQVRLRADGMNEATGNYYTYMRVTSTSQRNRYYLFDTGGSHVMCIIGIDGGNFEYNNSAGVQVFGTATPAINTWYRLRCERTSATNANYYVYAEDGTLLDSALNQTIDDWGNTNRIMLYSYDTIGAATVDWDNTSYSSTSEPAPPGPTGQYLNMKGFW